MKSRFSGCLLAFLIVFLVASLLGNAGLIAVLIGYNKEPNIKKESDYEEEFIEGKEKAKDKIAVIDLDGIITSSSETQMDGSMVDELTDKLKQARDDKAVKAVIVKIDSPGGEVNASDVIYHEIQKTRAVKPVVIYMGSLAASGGFYAAMGGSYLMASDLTLTGSIGVILETINYKDLISKIGVKAVVFKSGRFKDLLSGSRDITPAEQALVQAMIDETYNKFVSIVAKERKLDLQTLKDTIADGRVLTGTQALDARLIDGLGYFEDAIAKAKALGGTSKAQVIRYAPPFSLARYLRFLGEARMPALKLQIGPESAKVEPGKFYYLPAYLFANF